MPRPLPFEVLAELVTRLSDVVHAHSPALTTIGCARLHNLWAWDDAGARARRAAGALRIRTLEHPERDVDVFGMPPSALGVSRDVLLGEFPGNAPRAASRQARRRRRRRSSEYLEFALDARLRRRVAVELQRHRRLRPAAGRAAAAVRARGIPELVNPRCRA